MGATASRSVGEGHYATYREDILSGITPQIESLSLESIYSQYYFDHGRVTTTEGRGCYQSLTVSVTTFIQHCRNFIQWK